MTRFVSTLLVTACSLMAEGPDARDLVRRAVAREAGTVQQSRDYVFRFRDVERKIQPDASPRITKDETFEVAILYGRPFSRLIAREGRPLSPSEEAKVSSQFEREVAKRAKLSPDERARDDERLRRRDSQRVELLRQVPELYNFTIAGEEVVEGRKAWVLQADPRPDAKPRGLAARNLAQLHGQLWIDQAEERWIKVEADARKTITFGWILARIGPGSRVAFEQIRLPDGVWLPKRIEGRFLARLIGTRVALESETTYFDYRRFTSESRITSQEP